MAAALSAFAFGNTTVMPLTNPLSRGSQWLKRDITGIYLPIRYPYRISQILTILK